MNMLNDVWHQYYYILMLQHKIITAKREFFIILLLFHTLCGVNLHNTVSIYMRELLLFLKVI